MNKTIHGVYIPGWDKEETANNITLTFVLTGIIPSKKNRQRASFNYSWVFGQVRSFLKTRPTVDRKDVSTFITGLIRNIKPYIFKPKHIEEWEQWAGEIITKQAAAQVTSEKLKKHNIIFPANDITLKIRFYWADDYRRDSSNRLLTIEDLLVQRGIITDDDYKNLRKVSVEAKNYKDRITDHITVIHLTIYNTK